MSLWWQRQAPLVFFLAFSAFLLPGTVSAAYLINPGGAVLTHDGGTVPSNGPIGVRFEDLAFYRHDASASDQFRVHDGYLADEDSLSGATPQVTDGLPAPRDRDGDALATGELHGLAPTQQFDPGETVFLRVSRPLLDEDALGTRPDGRRFISMALRIETGTSGDEILNVALTETAPGSDVFIGYIPADQPVNLSGAALTMLYDAYGEVDDHEADLPPASVDSGKLSTLNARKLANAGQQMVPISDVLFLSKQASRSSVMQGDLLQYRIRLQNEGTDPVDDITVEDRLPKGFRYQNGSMRVDGARTEDPDISANGRDLSLELDELAPGAHVTITYVTEVSVGTEPGEAVNRAIARVSSGQSNEDRAVVQVERAFFDDRAFLMGRLIIGECGERDGQGREGVRLYLDDGTNVVTDEEGRWHIEGVRPGTGVLQVDTDTLGPRYSLRRCEENTRSAGNRKSRFFNVQGGTLWRENWYLEKKPEVKGRIEQQMRAEVVQNRALVTVEIANGETVFENVQTRLIIPDELEYVPGTARLDGERISDPDVEDEGGTLLFAMAPEGQYWRHRITVELAPDESARQSSDKPLNAHTLGYTPRGDRAEADSDDSYSVESTAVLHLHERQLAQQQITLRPEYESMASVPGPAGWDEIEEAVAHLHDVEDLHLEVVGHTDDVPIRWAPHRRIRSNQQLSEVRARNIADYIARDLGLDPEQVIARGMGDREPVADNNTAEGRARNRRVEVHAQIVREARPALLEEREPESGVDRAAGEDLQAVIEQTEPGFANLQDDMRVANPVISVNAVLEEGLDPELVVNGKTVSSERIGMVLEDERSGMLQYTWIGVELPSEGGHHLEIRGRDPFGNVRFNEEVSVTRTGRIEHIRLREVPENVADGRTPVRARLELFDEHGREIRSRAWLRVESGQLRPLEQAASRENPLDQETRLVEVDPDGYAWFDPVSEAGTYRMRLASDHARSDPMEVRVGPELRDWIMVGFAEGTVGYNNIERNIEDLPDAEEDFYTDGDTSFFARGRVRGEWLLTAAYDSRRDSEDQPLGQAIDPEQWYVLYGDNTRRHHDAPSSDRLYLRMERQDFHVMYGDFDTDLTVTELARYNRTLTGVKSEYTGNWFSAQAFASETGQAFQREEIPGDGTSGIYRLVNSGLIAGSERVHIETRDRFTNELISRENRTRFIDYSIDYDTGQLFFRDPVRVQDESFNPVRIVVEYELESAEDNVTGGGRVVVHDPGRRLQVGMTGVRDGTDAGDGRLGGADLTWKPNRKHRIYLEGARTDRDAEAGDGREEHDAWKAEHRYTSQALDTRVSVREQQDEFGLGQQSATESDIRRSEASGRYRLTERLSVEGEVNRQERLDADNRRDTAETRVAWEQTDWQLFGGARRASDRVAGETFRSDQVIAGGRRDLMDDRLRLRAQGEAAVSGDNDNTDYPNRMTIGADYRLTNDVSLFANHEYAWGHEFRARELRSGLRATPWRGATATGELGESRDEYGPRLFSHAGLHQTLDITQHWSGDFGVDRSQTLREGDPNPVFDERRPLTSGSRTLDYTAATAGLGYRTSRWQVTNRAEYRTSDLDDKWMLRSGFHHRLDGANTLAGRLSHIDRRLSGGEKTRETAGELSIAHRPLDGDWFVLNRLRGVLDSVEDQSSDLRGQRLINNLTTNFRPLARHQLALQHGARYVREAIDADRFTGYTDLWGAEYRYDIGRRFDIGARGSVLNSWNSGVRRESYGLMFGYTPMKDVWLSTGYNFRGFHDSDFDNALSRSGGFVMDFRIKFDQDSWRRNR